jgi:hypothetical protein
VSNSVFEAMIAALEQMVDEKVDYMTINNLGDPEKQHTIKAARSALALAREHAAAGGWRDIASAPKDGTPILGWSADDEHDVWWWAPYMVKGTDRGCWWNGVHTWGDCSPTHWMPISSPPSLPSEEG